MTTVVAVVHDLTICVHGFRARGLKPAPRNDSVEGLAANTRPAMRIRSDRTRAAGISQARAARAPSVAAARAERKAPLLGAGLAAPG